MTPEESMALAKDRLARFDAIVNDATAAQQRDDWEAYDEYRSELTDLSHELAGSLDWAVRELDKRNQE